MLPHDEDCGSTVTAPARAGTPTGGSASVAREPDVNTPSASASAGADIGLLTRSIRRGDAEAFSRIYDLFSFRLYKYLLVLARGDENDAREVCQAVFIKLAKRCDTFDDEHRFWAWLRVLGKNAYVDLCRERRRNNQFLSLEGLTIEAGDPMPPEHRLREAVRDALAALPAEERELLQAAYVDNRPLRDLAQENSQTYKAVESRLGLLRPKLKEQLLKDLRHETRV
jgi:RNA polymerase sigma factor (sigma-70 family)